MHEGFWICLSSPECIVVGSDCNVLKLGLSDRIVVTPQSVLICSFLVTCNVQHPSICMSAICVSSLAGCLCRSFALTLEKIGYPFSCCWVLRVLHFENIHLSVVSLADIFSLCLIFSIFWQCLLQNTNCKLLWIPSYWFYFYGLHLWY